MTDTPHTRESDEKLVYEILCDTTEPPDGRHWEGWMAEKIVRAISTPIPLTPSGEMVAAAFDATVTEGFPVSPILLRAALTAALNLMGGK